MNLFQLLKTFGIATTVASASIVGNLEIVHSEVPLPSQVIAQWNPFGDSDGDGCGDWDFTCNPHVKPVTRPLAIETWGETGRGLYVAAAEFMANDNAHLSLRSISPQRKELLKPEFGSLVDRVRVKYGADMMDRWGRGDFQISAGSAGQTFCDRIYIRAPYNENDDSQLILLAHELEHSRQCERFGGMSNFGYRYFKEFKKANQNYENNLLEREAREVEDKFARYIASLGRDFYFKNNCSEPIELLLRYRKPSGDWKTGGWWSFDPGEGAFLVSNGEDVRSDNSIFYYYAQIPDSNYTWSGDEEREFGGREYPMRQREISPDSDGDWYLPISCPNR